MVLLNGRVSPRSFSGWNWAPGLIRRILSGFQLCLAQTEADAGRLEALGAPKTRCYGNLKFAARPLPAKEGDLDLLAAFIGERPLWLAASTHPGEDEIAGAVHRMLEGRFPNLLTIIAPRHPGRGPAIAEKLRDDGMRVALRSTDDAVKPRTQVYVADTLGELGIFFRLAGVVFMGKSLVPLGGQNPLEAARLDCAVLLGPHVTNFADIVGRMKAVQACQEVGDGDALADAVGRLLEDGKGRMKLADAARRFANEEAGVLDAVITALEPYLNALAQEASGNEASGNEVGGEGS